MRKFLRTFFLCMLAAVTMTVYARAAEDTLKVGLYYGSTALFSANLQNFQGSGYRLGWFDENTREFVQIGALTQEKISMTAGGTFYVSGGAYSKTRPSRVDDAVGGYHVELDEAFATFDEAAYVAAQFQDAFPAFINNRHRVRLGSYESQAEAAAAAATCETYTWSRPDGGSQRFSGSVVSPSATGVTVTVTATSDVLFQFDCSGAKSLGVLPDGGAGKALTWFKGYKWYGGFEYRRSTGGDLNVINVVPLEDYVKGVLPYEMSPSWPLEALKAQAVCARTYALLQSKHYAGYRFDVCTTTDCQVYRGANQANGLTDRAVEETAGVLASYGGKLAETCYYSSNGGASESSENVWSYPQPYLVGTEDPYERTIDIPDYSYTVRYTYQELTDLLKKKGHSIGKVTSAYVSRTTPTGNVAELTFRDSAGKTVTVAKEDCRWLLSTRSMRFTISGGGGSSGGSAGLEGMWTISGGGVTEVLQGGEAYVITPAGTELLQQQPAVPSGTAASGTGVTITGTGYGHGVGMSQYGAKAMAQLGKTYREILTFYFTGITLEGALH